MVQTRKIIKYLILAINGNEVSSRDNLSLKIIKKNLLSTGFQKKLLFILQKKNSTALEYIINEFSFLYKKYENSIYSDKELNTLCLLSIYITYKYFKNSNSENINLIFNKDEKKISELNYEINIYT